MKWKLLVTAGIGLMVLLVSGALVGVALAEDPSGGPSKKDGLQQTFLSKVSKFLGVQEQQVVDAVRQAQLEMVDDAVKAGKLNQEQADRLKERIEKGGFWGPPGLQRPGQPKGKAQPWDGHDLLQIKALAEYLGMQPAELIAEFRAGKTLAQIGQEQGKSREELREAILSRLQKALDQAVANSRLTQERADQIKLKADQQIDKLLDQSLKQPPKLQQQRPGGKTPGNPGRTK